MDDKESREQLSSDATTQLLVKKLVERLHTFGLGEVIGLRVIKFFGLTSALDRVKANPYDLMLVPGISFRRADNIGRNIGIKEDDPRRQRALIMHILQEATNAGHVYLPLKELEKRTKKEKINLTGSDIIEKLVEERHLVVEGKWPIEPFEDCDIYLWKYHQAEKCVAEHLHQRLNLTQSALDLSYAGSDKKDVEWDKDQRAFITAFHKSNITVLTGGPGTGKTTVTKAVCESLIRNGISFALCAPTGKAAKRCSELTRHSASTIHRLLKGNPATGYWRYNRENRLSFFQYIIVDESSMLDIRLVYRILEAIPKETRIIFIGDVDQLQPVGPGSFFRDLIKSERFPIFRLQTNHRQGRGSLIADNALSINRGSLKFSFNNDDFFFVEAESGPVVRDKLMHIIKVLRDKFGYTDQVKDVQILTPQKKTTIGTEKLNELLRFRINEKADADEQFSIGDKVMQTSNDYRLKIFNGFVGQIINVTPTHYVINFFDGDVGEKVIKYPRTKRRALMHAYACTVHKYQGSEIKVGILVISSVHTWMLTRNLLYTGITRCKEVCVLVGDRMGLKKAIKNNREAVRYSKLLERIAAFSVPKKEDGGDKPETGAGQKSFIY